MDLQHCLFVAQGKPGHEIQSATLELINGLVSLVYPPGMPDVAQVSPYPTGPCRLCVI
jgi:hypothetical protein